MNPSNESNPSSLRDIYLRALDKKSPEAREAYLEGACGDNLSLRNKVDALLRENAEDSFLETPAVENNETLLEAPTEMPGTLIGRYKILQPIGEGGFGTVYMAEQKEPVRRRVALKIIKLGMDTKQVVARFEAERQALAMMDHPNIAKVLDAGATDAGRPYFVMELVRGISITKYCDENNLSALERLNLFMNVCSAIQHAHQKGIIHRDIKPSNIMITLHDGEPVPKVIDFGIAKATQQELTEKTLFTQYSQFIGTPAYMSPEQAEMSGLDVDTRSDIYSLGVLLYELLTGRTPLDREELMSGGYDEIRRRIREEEPSKPSTRVSTMVGEERTKVAKQRNVDAGKLSHLLRGDLDWVVMKALEKDRIRRYETANALRSDVQRFLNNEPVTAVKPSPTYLLGKYVRRHKTVVGFATAIAILLIAATAVSGLFAWKASKAEMAQGKLNKEVIKTNIKLQDMVYKASTGQAKSILLVGERGYHDQVWDLIQQAKESDSSLVDKVALRSIAVETIMDPQAYPLIQVTNSIPNQDQLTVAERSGESWILGYSDGSILVKSMLTAETIAEMRTEADQSIQSITHISALNQWAATDTLGDLYIWKPDTTNYKFESKALYHFGKDATVYLVDAGSGFLAGQEGATELYYWNLTSSESPIRIKLKFPLEKATIPSSILSVNRFQMDCNDAGTLVAIGFGSQNMIEILELPSGESTVIDTPGNHNAPGFILPKFSPDGQHLACTWTRNIAVYETKGWVRVFQNPINESVFTSILRFSPNGEIWTRDNAWDVQGNMIHGNMKSVNGYPIFKGPSFEEFKVIDSINHSSSKAWINLSLPESKSLPFAQFEALAESTILGANFSPNNQLMAFSNSSGKVSLMDLKMRREVRLEGNTELSVPEDPSFSSDGTLLASTTRRKGDSSSEVLIWDIQTGSLIHHQPFRNYLRMAVFHPKRPWLFAVGEKHLMIWKYNYESQDSVNTSTLRLTLIKEKPLENGTAGCVRFSDDGQLAAWTEGNEHWSGTPFIMDLDTYDTMRIPVTQVDAHHGFEFFPNSHLLLLRGHTNKGTELTSVQFDPDRGTLHNFGEDFDLKDFILGGFRHSPTEENLVDFRNNQLFFWQFPSPDSKPVLLFEMKFRCDYVISTAWSQDGTKLAISRSDGIAEVWDIAELRRQLAELGLDWESAKQN